MDFCRQPRVSAPAVAGGDVTLEPPPAVPKAAPANVLARLLPVGMLVAAAGMTVLYFTSGAASTSRGPMSMFFPVMMVGSVLGSLVYSTRSTHHIGELTDDRREYLGYLEGLDRAIAGTAADQHRGLHWTHPDPAALWTLIGGPRMWERAVGESDFCHVRVGRGNQPLCTTLVVPEFATPDKVDPVTASALLRLIRRRSVVTDVPVVAGLRTVSALTVDADPAAARALIRAIVCQLAVLHSPADLRIAAVVGPTSEDNWDWLKWLPHHQHSRLRDGLGSARMTYRSLAEVLTACGSPDGSGPPHTVVIVDDGGAPVLEQPFTDGPRMQLNHHGDTRLDGLSREQATICARRLARYRPVANDSAGHSAVVSWRELMGLDDCENLNAAEEWDRRQGRQRLRAPIGVSEHGDPVVLDIKRPPETAWARTACVSGRRDPESRSSCEP